MPLFFITTATEHNYRQEYCHCKKKEAIFYEFVHDKYWLESYLF